MELITLYTIKSSPSTRSFSASEDHSQAPVVTKQQQQQQ